MVWVRSRGIFTIATVRTISLVPFPLDLRHRFPKRKDRGLTSYKIRIKGCQICRCLSDRLERYWDSLRMEMIYSKELGLTVLPDARPAASDSFSLTDALALYHRLKGTAKTHLFFESSERSIRYLIECLGHDSFDITRGVRRRTFQGLPVQTRHVLIISEACLLLCAGCDQPCDQGTWSIGNKCLQRHLHPR